ncbi:MAG: hypothetical protein KJ814_07315, partial [Proteobacteria bacterium]|nr:hypothetical protein [Pseudomonadota bacterium]
MEIRVPSFYFPWFVLQFSDTIEPERIDDARTTRGRDPLPPAEWRWVERAAAVVLPRAVECRGTTVSDW